MECKEFKELLNVYMDGELAGGEADNVRRHLEKCPVCSREIAELNKVRQLVNELPRLKAPPELAGQVSRQLAQVQGGGLPKTNIFRRYRWAMRGLATAAAAVLVVCVGLFVIRHEPPAGQKPNELTPTAITTAPKIEKKVEEKENNVLAQPEEMEKDSLDSGTKDIKAKGGNFVEKPIPATPPLATTRIQEVHITCKNTKIALQQIKNMVAQAYNEPREELDNSGSGRGFGKGEQPQTQGMNKQIDSQKKEELKEETKPDRIKITMSLDQREAFLAQLEKQQIGIVKIVERGTPQAQTEPLKQEYEQAELTDRDETSKTKGYGDVKEELHLESPPTADKAEERIQKPNEGESPRIVPPGVPDADKITEGRELKKLDLVPEVGRQETKKTSKPQMIELVIILEEEKPNK